MANRNDYLQIVSMSPRAAMQFAERQDRPDDLGLPAYPDRHAAGARVGLQG